MSAYADLTKMENSRNCLRRIARHDESQCSKDSIINMMEKFVKTVKIMDETILIPCRLMDRQVGDSTDIIPAPGKNSTSNQLTLNSSAQGKRGIEKSKNIHEFLNSSDLFNLYNVLNTLKNELLWTGKDETVDDSDEFDAGIYTSGTTTKITNAARLNDYETTKTEPINRTETVNNSTTTTTTAATTTTVKGHVRRPSTASVASTASVSNLSDSESEISNENDSGMESECNKSDNPQSSSGSISSCDNVCIQKKAANVDKATELAKRCKRHLNGLFQCLEQMTEAANYLTARYQSDIGPV